MPKCIVGEKGWRVLLLPLSGVWWSWGEDAASPGPTRRPSSSSVLAEAERRNEQGCVCVRVCLISSAEFLSQMPETDI